MADATALAEIEKLEKAIAQRKTESKPSSSYSSRPPYSKSSTSNTYRASPYPHYGAKTTTFKNKKLVLNSGSSVSTTSASTSASTAATIPTASTSSTPVDELSSSSSSIAVVLPVSSQWVKKTDRNMSLMNAETYQKTEKARMDREKKAAEKKAAAPPPPPPSSAPRQVVVDGILFEFDKTGTKLNRVEGQASVASPTSRNRTTHDGQEYLRTKSGNLLSASVVRNRKKQAYIPGLKSMSKEVMDAKRQRLGNMTLVLNGMQKARHAGKTTSSKQPKKPPPKSKTLCRFYTKTGTCRNGSDCKYPHIRVSDDAELCEDFTILGYCEAGPTCEKKHAWECKEFAEKGTCSKGGKCGLMHVLRAQNGKTLDEDDAKVGSIIPEEDDEDQLPTTSIATASAPISATSKTTNPNLKRKKGDKSQLRAALVDQDDFIQLNFSSDEEDEVSSGEEEEDEEDDDDSVESLEEELLDGDTRMMADLSDESENDAAEVAGAVALSTDEEDYNDDDDDDGNEDRTVRH